MYLKPAGEPNTFDVFLGEGWDSWSRARLNPDGSVVITHGIRLKGHFLSHLQNMIQNVFYSDLRSKKRK